MGNLTAQVEAQYSDAIETAKKNVATYESQLSSLKGARQPYVDKLNTWKNKLNTFKGLDISGWNRSVWDYWKKEYGSYYPHSDSSVGWTWSAEEFSTNTPGGDKFKSEMITFISRYINAIAVKVNSYSTQITEKTGLLSDARNQLDKLLAEYKLAMDSAVRQENQTTMAQATAEQMTDPILLAAATEAEITLAEQEQKSQTQRIIIFGAIGVVILAIGAYVMVKS